MHEFIFQYFYFLIPIRLIGDPEDWISDNWSFAAHIDFFSQMSCFKLVRKKKLSVRMIRIRPLDIFSHLVCQHLRMNFSIYNSQIYNLTFCSASYDMTVKQITIWQHKYITFRFLFRWMLYKWNGEKFWVGFSCMLDLFFCFFKSIIVWMFKYLLTLWINENFTIWSIFSWFFKNTLEQC